MPPREKPPPFKEYLNEILEAGKQSGRIGQSQLDRLLNAEDFDETEFELFLDVAREVGIEIHDITPDVQDLDRSAASLDSMKLYLADISRYPLLTAEEEVN